MYQLLPQLHGFYIKISHVNTNTFRIRNTERHQNPLLVKQDKNFQVPSSTLQLGYQKENCYIKKILEIQ